MVELFNDYHGLSGEELSALFTDEETTTGLFVEASNDEE
jgi:hypothetical protein